MLNESLHFFETIAALIIAVAIIALLVSPKAKTASVIQASASGFGNDLAVAEAPVTGASTPINLSYPSSSPWDGSPFMG
jgi:PRD1 phage membrane DNA delivery